MTTTVTSAMITTIRMLMRTTVISTKTTITTRAFVADQMQITSKTRVFMMEVGDEGSSIMFQTTTTTTTTITTTTTATAVDQMQIVLGSEA